MTTKVAVDESSAPMGFIHMVPIESPTSGMIGRDLMVIPCLTINYQLVYNQIHGTGVGRVLMEACEQEARQRGFKGLAVLAYTDNFWFMPSTFFKKVGFTRVSVESDIWIKNWAEVEDPTELKNKYRHRSVPGKVVIDYFWSPFCFTVCKEIINIRKVVSEFGDNVELREYRTDDPESIAKHGMLRALYINGHQKNWGYEAPQDELRKEITKALNT